jgi:hypothetical protein
MPQQPPASSAQSAPATGPLSPREAATGQAAAAAAANPTVIDVYGILSAQQVNATFSGGLVPSGRDDTATIQNALNAAEAAGRAVMLAAGTFITSAPLVIPPGVALVGVNANEVTTTADFIAGTVIQPSASFSQGSAAGNAVFLMLGQAVGGFTRPSEEQKIIAIMVDGSKLRGGNSVDGVRFVGGVRRCRLERFLIANVGGNGVNCVRDSSGVLPGALRLVRVTVRFGKVGFAMFRVADSTAIDCLAESNSSDGWRITNGSNSAFIGCRSEHSGANGFAHISTQQAAGSGGCKYVGCSTDRNDRYGMQITSSNGTGTPVILSGCYFRRDGRNGGSGGGGLAGLFITGFPSAVQVSGCVIFPGVDDGGGGANSPDTGLLLAANNTARTAVVVTGTFIQGAATAIRDDGTSNVLYDNSVVTATGTTSAPNLNVPPYLARMFLASVAVRGASATSFSPLTVTNTASGAAPAVQVTGRAAGNAAFGIEVTGDKSNRFRVDTNGLIKWGPGDAGQDCQLGRISAHALGISATDFAIGTAGRGLKVAEGANAKMGTAVLNGLAEVTVPTTAVTARSRIFLTINSPGGTPGAPYVAGRQAGASFGIKSTGAADTSTVAWFIVEPA